MKDGFGRVGRGWLFRRLHQTVSAFPFRHVTHFDLALHHLGLEVVLTGVRQHLDPAHLPDVDVAAGRSFPEIRDDVVEADLLLHVRGPPVKEVKLFARLHTITTASVD